MEGRERRRHGSDRAQVAALNFIAPRETRERVSLFCLAAAVVVILAGCGTTQQEDALRAVKARGVLRVGAPGDYKPMSFRDGATGKYRGLDADLAEELALKDLLLLFPAERKTTDAEVLLLPFPAEK